MKRSPEGELLLIPGIASEDGGFELTLGKNNVPRMGI